jgi:hypothetical protein
MVHGMMMITMAVAMAIAMMIIMAAHPDPEVVGAEATGHGAAAAA